MEKKTKYVKIAIVVLVLSALINTILSFTSDSKPPFWPLRIVVWAFEISSLFFVLGSLISYKKREKNEKEEEDKTLESQVKHI